MKVTKRNPYLSIINEFLIDSPVPSNVNYLYSFGSLLGLCLVILIITGVGLAMHYVPNTALAFESVEHIMRDVHNGLLIRNLHANTVSFFFICVYIHIARGLYYGSYRQPRHLLLITGVIIYLVMMATAFLGYVLPLGQMSYLGATVITNLFSAIPLVGQDFVHLLLGGFSADNPTLNRFFSLHFLLPLLLAAFAMIHLIALHEFGSNNSEGLSSTTDRIRFHPYSTYKDFVGFLLILLFIGLFVFFYPHSLGHPDNNIPANPLVTPPHIQPELYYLPFYAILRAIPDKLGGVIAMFSSILILLPLAMINQLNIRSNRYKPVLQILFLIFVGNFLFLLILGAKPIEEPYVILGQISTVIYFSYFFILMLIG